MPRVSSSSPEEGQAGRKQRPIVAKEAAVTPVTSHRCSVCLRFTQGPGDCPALGRAAVLYGRGETSLPRDFCEAV